MGRWAGALSPAFVDGAYRTVPGERSLLARFFPGLDFYTWFTYFVCKGSRSARLGRYGDADWSQNSLEVMHALEAVGVRIEITGTDRFSRLAGPCVFIGNHMSTLEAFVLPTIIQPLKRVAFVVKKSLVEYPIFGHLMRSRDPIVVGRTNPREDLKAVLEGGLERLHSGVSIVVFPQKTRSALFDPAAFNSIGIKLAKRAQVPVVPLALKTDAWGNGAFLKDFGKIDPAKAVHFAFGEPLRIQGSGSAEHHQVVEFIRERLVSWGGSVAPRVMPLPDGPLVRRVRLELPHPTDADHAADLDRVLRGLEGRGWPGVLAPLGVVAGLPKTLRAGNFAVVATLAVVPVPTLLRIEPASVPYRNLGLAVDLGSTNIVGALIDLDTGETLGERSTLNPQVEHGEDILARTHLCLHKGGLERLQSLAVAAIGEIASRLAPPAGIEVGDICCVCVAGNTTMAHFLLGLDPFHLCRAPYVPVANRFPVVRASELGLGVNPAAPVVVLPNVGSYVGGDALAGVLVSGMHTRERVSLLVDIGTNAEIVVGNREFLLVGAGSAGPGLEGGVVRHGMRAAPGAIERIAIDPRTLLPTFDVIGGGAPRGICGSGLIDLMAGLFSTGIVDGRGKFVLPSPSPRVVVREDSPCFVVAEADAAAGRGEILFMQSDMDNLMLSKAAMYTMLTVMTDAAGVSFDELERFFIAGAFGAYVAADKAVTIGMVPDIPLEKFRLLGNSSLEGAKRVLLSVGALEEIERIGRAMTYVEMNESREFMNGFMAARFLPHTDLDLFPSVRERFAATPPKSRVLHHPS